MMDSYRGGQFSNLQRDEDLRLCEDKVFVGLYNALDDSVILDARRRNMDPALLAVQRLNGVLSEIGHVIGVVGAGIQQVPLTLVRDMLRE